MKRIALITTVLICAMAAGSVFLAGPQMANAANYYDVYPPYVSCLKQGSNSDLPNCEECLGEICKENMNSDDPSGISMNECKEYCYDVYPPCDICEKRKCKNDENCFAAHQSRCFTSDDGQQGWTGCGESGAGYICDVCRGKSCDGGHCFARTLHACSTDHNPHGKWKKCKSGGGGGSKCTNAKKKMCMKDSGKKCVVENKKAKCKKKDDGGGGDDLCSKKDRTGYFDRDECVRRYKSVKDDPNSGFKLCKRDGWPYVVMFENTGFRVGCSRHPKGDLCSPNAIRLICPVESDDYKDDGGSSNIDKLKKEYKDAKKAKKDAWANYLKVKEKAKSAFKTSKKDAWESYLDKKADALKTYKDKKAEAKKKYLKTKKNYRDDYLDSKKAARVKYDDIKASYEVARAAYKKCRKDGGSKKDCKDKRDKYKDLRDDRNEALKDYKEIKADAKSAYESKRDEAKEAYVETRDAAKKTYQGDKKKERSKYDETKLELMATYKGNVGNARGNYDELKKIYLKAKEAYDKARGK